jgi:hypothetical protein
MKRGPGSVVQIGEIILMSSSARQEWLVGVGLTRVLEKSRSNQNELKMPQNSLKVTKKS